MRRISFRLTQEQVLDRSKTVTRRLGWKTLKPGTRLRGVDRAMGFPKGSKAADLSKTLCFVEVVSVRRERLDAITADDVVREGFPGMTAAEFVAFFCESMNCKPDTEVTRIEFRYLDPEEAEKPQELDRDQAARLLAMLEEGETQQACELAISCDPGVAQLHPGRIPSLIWLRASRIFFTQLPLFDLEAA